LAQGFELKAGGEGKDKILHRRPRSNEF